MVHPPEAPHGKLSLLLRQHAIEQLAAASGALLLGCQQIHRHDDPDEEIFGKDDNAPHTGDQAAGKIGNGGLQPRQQLGGEPLDGLVVVAVKQVRQLRIVAEQAGNPVINGGIVALQIVHQGGDAVHQLGHQHAQQQVHQH